MLDQTAVEQLISAIRGRLILPGDEDYNDARSIWNGMVDKKPAMIAQCTGAADVITAVNFARENSLKVSVRGGGHNAAGSAICDDGLVIDLSQMKEVTVDPNAKLAYVSAGATLGDMDHETQAFGLATTGGVDSRTGVAGLTLGGGIGYLARTYGLSADNLVAADVVTANGELIHVSEEEHSDLLWALRGGGGNFGIVTQFVFQLHEVGPEVQVAQVFYPMDQAKEILHFYRDFSDQAPDELSCYVMIVRTPPVPPFPEMYHGKPALALAACYSGSVEEGKKAIAPLQNLGEPILKVITPMPYKILQSSNDAGTPDGYRYYFKSQFMSELSDEVIHLTVEYAKDFPGELTMLGFEPMGGAINRVPKEATAFPHRDAKYNFGLFSGWIDPKDDDKMLAWSRDFHQAMQPYTMSGVYSNYLDHDDENRLRAAFGDNLERLREVKAKYDPSNFFSPSKNIKL
ncbi:MAG: FAD-binding oxidoreductase [Bacillus sp. (in: Bacteria)]|nr:FAD-binding oxidoreductase [Bacillus sp. (in: firmicutes)]